MKTLKQSGVKLEYGMKDKLLKMNSQLTDLFDVVELGEIPGCNKYLTTRM